MSKSLLPETLPEKSPEMEAKIWSRLPEELLDLILAHLPPHCFLHLRATCKRFNSLIFSPSFLSLHSPKSQPSSRFLLLRHPQFQHRFPLYDSFLDRWRFVSLPQSPCADLLSAASGLLCFSISSTTFLVCNLLTKSLRRITCPQNSTFLSATIIPSPNGYKIFTLYTSCSCIYDSGSHEWSQFDGFNPVFRKNFHQEGTFCNGFLYFTTSEPYSVVGFEIQNGIWKILDAEIPVALTFIRLASCGDRVFMVGGVGNNGISKSLCVWELGEGRREWVELQRLPELMCRKFFAVSYHNYEHVYCIGHDDFVCVCCYTWPEVLVYKISRRTWHWLPKCPFLPEKWNCGFRWFSFVPDLYALV